MNQAQIDFQQLRIKHILFKSKVRSVLYGGTLDVDFFSSQGPINTWFSAVGLSRYHNVPGMSELRQTQLNLNAAADNLFSLYKRGKIEEAHAGLSTIESLSEKFVQLLSSLEGKLAA
jgi:hypothetical protein